MPPVDGASADDANTVRIELAIREGASRLVAAPTALLDARVLMKFVLGASDADLIARARDPLTDDDHKRYLKLIDERAGGKPIAYITGVQEFWSLPFSVSQDVLIPRPDSECLIEAVLGAVSRTGEMRILDLGTGSGCLLCALLSELPAATGLGVDQSSAAVRIAQDNADNLGLGLRAQFAVSDWFEAVSGAFNVIIINAPYIKEGDRDELPRDVAAFEPHGALFSGVDGLDDYRRILQNLDGFLVKNGVLVAECASDQAGELSRMVAESVSHATVTIVKDMENRSRGVLAVRG